MRRAVVVGLSVLVCLVVVATPRCSAGAVTVAYAQTQPAVDQGDTGGSAQQSGDVDGGHQQNPIEQLIAWSEGGNLNTVVLKTAAYLFSRLVVAAVTWIGDAVGGSFGGGPEDIMVQLPRSMTLGAGWVIAGHALFSRVFDAAVYGAFLLALLVAAAGGLLGFTSVEAKSVLAVSVLAWYANRRALEFVGYLLSVANTLAAQFANPTDLLPGWDRLSDFQRGSGEGLMVFATGVAGLLLAFTRWLTLLGVNLLVVLMPLAILCAIHPATRGWFSLWWRTLVALLYVQVPMALAIGQGQALLGHYGAGAGGGSLVAAMACYWLASKMPKMVGGLAALPGQATSGIGRTVTQVATFAAAGWAGGQVVAGRTVVSPVPQTDGGFGGGTSPFYGTGPTWYRSGPLLPAPMPSLARPAAESWPGTDTRTAPDPTIDVDPLSVE